MRPAVSCMSRYAAATVKSLTPSHVPSWWVVCLGNVPDKIIMAAGAQVGDAVLLTKGLAIEAVSILARERADEIRRRHGTHFLARCRRYLIKPGLSVLKEAQEAMADGGVHAMHDPTEGGLSSALYELAEAAKVGLKIEADAIRILPEAAQLCADFRLNPLGAIASGALLITIDQAFEGRTLARLRAAQIPSTRIGTVVPRRNGVTLIKDGCARPFPRFAVDELAKFFQRSHSPKANLSHVITIAGSARR